MLVPLQQRQSLRDRGGERARRNDSAHCPPHETLPPRIASDAAVGATRLQRLGSCLVKKRPNSMPGWHHSGRIKQRK
jgi:hypothetical protein